MIKSNYKVLNLNGNTMLVFIIFNVKYKLELNWAKLSSALVELK